ncbi:hypothetical protein E2C01_070159 [Portunus trituberculatus]|uniref:Uncharacterized protein n=1 Tax=Portunus trituberculatus TaxID=210409 RepID=A0A5B7I0U3_PORTR|nr:hypothetical protein [Portunus trituberculatus]
MWAFHGNFWAKGDTFLGYLLSQSPPAKKPLPRVRKPSLQSDRGQDSNPCAWRLLGPQSTHGSTVPRRPDTVGHHCRLMAWPPNAHTGGLSVTRTAGYSFASLISVSPRGPTTWRRMCGGTSTFITTLFFSWRRCSASHSLSSIACRRRVICSATVSTCVLGPSMITSRDVRSCGRGILTHV